MSIAGLTGCPTTADYLFRMFLEERQEERCVFGRMGEVGDVSRLVNFFPPNVSKMLGENVNDWCDGRRAVIAQS